MIAVIVLLCGLGFLAFQIFVNTGGKAKFKSDLPKTETVKKRGKIKCYTILSLTLLAVLLLMLMLLSHIL